MLVNRGQICGLACFSTVKIKKTETADFTADFFFG